MPSDNFEKILQEELDKLINPIEVDGAERKERLKKVLERFIRNAVSKKNSDAAMSVSAVVKILSDLPEFKKAEYIRNKIYHFANILKENQLLKACKVNGKLAYKLSKKIDAPFKKLLEADRVKATQDEETELPAEEISNGRNQNSLKRKHNSINNRSDHFQGIKKPKTLFWNNINKLSIYLKSIKFEKLLAEKIDMKNCCDSTGVAYFKAFKLLIEKTVLSKVNFFDKFELDNIKKIIKREYAIELVNDELLRRTKRLITPFEDKFTVNVGLLSEIRLNAREEKSNEYFYFDKCRADQESASVSVIADWVECFECETKNGDKKNKPDADRQDIALEKQVVARIANYIIELHLAGEMDAIQAVERYLFKYSKALHNKFFKGNQLVGDMEKRLQLDKETIETLNSIGPELLTNFNYCLKR